MQINTIPSSLDPSKHQVGIVHIGLGAFHRAHQAVYGEQVLALHGGDWMIASANIRSNYQLVEQLNKANNQYQVIEYADSQHFTIRSIKAIKQTLFSGTKEGGLDLINTLVAPHIKIVTLTVTEKGYYLAPSTGALLVDNPDIQHDIASPDTPKTALGFIVVALKLRREKGMPPFTVLSCDNMPHNGKRTKNAVVALAHAQNPALAQWIESHVAFPSSMVDRIVPAVTPEDLADIERDTGISEPTVVKCEQFSQWVVEDHFPAGRPKWEDVGVEMVDDVAQYEMMKLRMLNGSHSLLAYLGSLAGYKTVAQAMQDEAIGRLLEGFMLKEVAPTLSGFPESMLTDYYQRLIARFKNDSLQHQLIQIAMDGSQKLPQRWLGTLVEQRGVFHKTPAIELGIAGWMAFIYLAEKAQRSINDPLESDLFNIMKQPNATASELVTACLSRDDIFPVEIRSDSDCVSRMVHYFSALINKTRVQELIHSSY
ncbi:Mannitol 2-dehydrogenase [Marinomonas spartinae]|uniref:Mannitol 2-dehydrogenase n=1 Tax=Marinomonas spartinae TaxID=1792290 RepID=A0A1A8T2T0_9GAMM|nr:mannitol dehydrogenase family protein [Marinomonas spartinae]SBS24735.1 Mannitol 2-dehydrogenase [Marinomonas spartinae]SBS25298.1 Mannitol 2-dehydrogenase [Marinomonas spartinae]